MSFINPKNVLEQISIEPGSKAADFGCGHGSLTIGLAKLVGKDGVVHAIDVLKSCLESVKSRASLENLNNLNLIRANLEVLGSTGIGDNSLDLVLMANVLFQSPLKQEIFREAHRVLKPGSRVIVVDWKIKDTRIGPESKHRVEPDDIKNMAQKTGFSYKREFDAGEYHFGLEFVKE